MGKLLGIGVLLGALLVGYFAFRGDAEQVALPTPTAETPTDTATPTAVTTPVIPPTTAPNPTATVAPTATPTEAPTTVPPTATPSPAVPTPTAVVATAAPTATPTATPGPVARLILTANPGVITCNSTNQVIIQAVAVDASDRAVPVNTGNVIISAPGSIFQDVTVPFVNGVATGAVTPVGHAGATAVSARVEASGQAQRIAPMGTTNFTCIFSIFSTN